MSASLSISKVFSKIFGRHGRNDARPEEAACWPPDAETTIRPARYASETMTLQRQDAPGTTLLPSRDAPGTTLLPSRDAPGTTPAPRPGGARYRLSPEAFRETTLLPAQAPWTRDAG
jgi:hypothetical protein